MDKVETRMKLKEHKFQIGEIVYLNGMSGIVSFITLNTTSVFFSTINRELVFCENGTADFGQLVK